ncbi:MAG: carbohydrate-binding domain-containing protein [Phaeodactylibacter sp.]|nr:carbohydrate-binding domain-containing protein [Phaeodactylibacter sp.]
MKTKGFLPTTLTVIAILAACQKEDFSIGKVVDSVYTDYTVASVLAGNYAGHGDASDYTWDASSEISIELNGNAIASNSPHVVIDGTKATVTAAGNYKVTGTLDNGQLIVETADEGPVRLILNGVNITNATSSAIFIANAEKTVVVLNDGSENFLTDGSSYVFENAGDDEPDATLFSKDNLSITGKGALVIDANYRDAITSKDGLVINNGNISVQAKDDGIRGKDYLIIEDGDITVDAGGDGLKSNNDEDASRGYVYIKNGSFDINAGADAIQAVTDVLVGSGTLGLVAGGGSSSSLSNNTAKGLKAGVHLVIDGGTFSINTADDAMHSNNNLCINGGSFNISSRDDGIHADSTLIVNGGEIVVSKSYEGMESMVAVINNGNINLTSSDDGLNAAGGRDGSAGGNFPGGPFEYSSEDFFISINGGYIVIKAAGDGIDANGSIAMTGGTVLVNGPTAQDNGAIDYDIDFEISGGLLVAVGSANMAQAPESSSDQYSILARFNSTITAGKLVHIETSAGEDILTFQPSKNFQSLVFSSPDLQKGAGYSLYTGGDHSGTATDGLYEGGSYTPGVKFADFTVTGKVTVVR